MKRISLCFAFLSLLLAYGCGGDIEPGRTAEERSVVRGLPLATVTSAPVAAAESFVGTVESADRGIIAARIDGRVTRIAVREGDRVEAGQLLLTIGENPARDRLAEAEGARNAAAARLELAERTADRYRRLYAGEAVTPQEMDRVEAELEMARQGMRSATAAAEAARTALSYTRVLAPYPARLVRREVDEGTTVQPGTPLLVLDRAGKWRVRARLPESLFGRVAVGEKASVDIPALGRTLEGSVTEILPAADPRSRAFEVKITLTEGSGLGAGMYARVGFGQAPASALLAPATAIVQRGQLTGVYVVKEGILHYRLVRTGRTLGDRVEVLSGLDEGESIVAAQTEKARDGARLEE